MPIYFYIYVDIIETILCGLIYGGTCASSNLSGIRTRLLFCVHCVSRLSPNQVTCSGFSHPYMSDVFRDTLA
jgi:hypothetical protein